MLPFQFGHTLHRSPLAPSVPLDGSDTVQGLQTLERLRAANLLNDGNKASTSGSNNNRPSAGSINWDSRRRKYQRFKGPFIEQMSIDDIKRDPKPWKLFGINGDQGTFNEAYNVPASLDILAERFEENIAAYLPNYIRVALLLLMLTFYIRPSALLGAVSLACSMYFNFTKLLAEQEIAALQTTNPAAAAALRRQHQDPSQQSMALAATIVSWILVAYTRCLPIIILGSFIAVIGVSIHASSRRAPSEYRYRGRSPLGYTFMQVLGLAPVAGSSDPRLVFKQLAAALSRTIHWRSVMMWRYGKYYLLMLRDAIRQPFSKRASPTWGS